MKKYNVHVIVAFLIGVLVTLQWARTELETQLTAALITCVSEFYP